MPQSCANVTVHLVFSTKNRSAFLRKPEIRERLHRQLGGVTKTLNSPPIVIGGFEDHVHILAKQARTITLADWVKELKRVTSLWIKEEFPALTTFAWQSGYGAFSVSQSDVSRVSDYIQRQEEHHQRFDFKAEFRTLLQRYEIEYDEQYVWD